jgi:hypothetical protein
MGYDESVMKAKKSIEEAEKIIDKSNKDIIMSCNCLAEGIDSMGARTDKDSNSGFKSLITMRDSKIVINQVRKKCVARLKTF